MKNETEIKSKSKSENIRKIKLNEMTNITCTAFILHTNMTAIHNRALNTIPATNFLVLIAKKHEIISINVPNSKLEKKISCVSNKIMRQYPYNSEHRKNGKYM